MTMRFVVITASSTLGQSGSQPEGFERGIAPMLNTPLFFQLVTHFCMQACNPTHMSKLEADLATTKVRRVSVMLKPIELS